MKPFSLALCLFATQILFSQDFISISSTGIGEIKIMMPLEKVSPLLESTEVLKLTKPNSFGTDSIQALYKGITLKIGLQAMQNEDDQWEWRVNSLKSDDARLKTKSGIVVGWDKFEVIRKLDGLRLNLMPDWEYEDQKDAKRYSLVIINDWDNGTELTMRFFDNKLVSFLIIFSEGC